MSCCIILKLFVVLVLLPYKNMVSVVPVLVQDKSNGRVHTVIDNRAALTAARLAGGNKESMAAMSQLLSGGKRDN